MVWITAIVMLVVNLAAGIAVAIVATVGTTVATQSIATLGARSILGYKTKQSRDDDSVGLMIGVVVGLLLTVLVISIAIICVFIWLGLSSEKCFKAMIRDPSVLNVTATKLPTST
jgi:biopolymer transport protein ExbB/TolQ